jgi:uncharacterized protein (TIGR01777 family)
VRTLSRGLDGDVQWDVAAGRFDFAALQGVDVVIHLAGESVAQRWTEASRARILNSRVDSTRLLVQAILEQSQPPAYLAASGISYYGVDQASPVDESSQTGSGFLAEVTRQWEAAAQPLVASGVRVAFLRTGIVLSREGGALAKILLPFRLGLGGRIGDGRQQMSWISLPDLVAVYIFLVEHGSARGVFNAVAPQPVSNQEFTKILGRVLARPTIFPLPAVVVRALFGEMGQETVLSNLAVLPARLNELGFTWQWSDLELALMEILGLASVPYNGSG